MEQLKKKIEEADSKLSLKEMEYEELLENMDEIRRSNESMASLRIKLETDYQLLSVSIQLYLQYTK